MLSMDGTIWTMAVHTPRWTRPQIGFCLALVSPSHMGNNRAHVVHERYRGRGSLYVETTCYLKAIILGVNLYWRRPYDAERKTALRFWVWPPPRRLS